MVKYTVKSFTKVEIFYGLTEFCLDVSQDKTGQKIHGDALKYLLLNSDIKSNKHVVLDHKNSLKYYSILQSCNGSEILGTIFSLQYTSEVLMSRQISCLLILKKTLFVSNAQMQSTPLPWSYPWCLTQSTTFQHLVYWFSCSGITQCLSNLLYTLGPVIIMSVSRTTSDLCLLQYNCEKTHKCLALSFLHSPTKLCVSSPIPYLLHYVLSIDIVRLVEDEWAYAEQKITVHQSQISHMIPQMSLYTCNIFYYSKMILNDV